MCVNVITCINDQGSYVLIGRMMRIVSRDMKIFLPCTLNAYISKYLCLLLLPCRGAWAVARYM